MLQIVDDHRWGLKIDDSKQMMVGIVYGMPFELDQFGLFHVSMHIDATANSYNEGHPLVKSGNRHFKGFQWQFFIISTSISAK